MQRIETLWKQLRLIDAFGTKRTSIKLFSTEKPPDDNIKKTKDVNTEIKEIKPHEAIENKFSDEKVKNESDESIEDLSSISISNIESNRMESDKDLTQPEVKLSGFAETFKKFSQIDEPKEPEKLLTFATLLRRSEFMNVCHLYLITLRPIVIYLFSIANNYIAVGRSRREKGRRKNI